MLKNPIPKLVEIPKDKKTQKTEVDFLKSRIKELEKIIADLKKNCKCVPLTDDQKKELEEKKRIAKEKSDEKRKERLEKDEKQRMELEQEQREQKQKLISTQLMLENMQKENLNLSELLNKKFKTI